MNYKIIHDEEALRGFIDWLPELGPNEKFYCCLFARKKYVGEIKSNDKTQLKRFLSDKGRLYEKIKQLEVETGAYKINKETIAPEGSLALYITPNPRDMEKATFDSIINLTKLLKDRNGHLNPHQEILSTIQRSSSKKIYVDFDIDDKTFDLKRLAEFININALQILETRGGYHILVKLKEIEEKYKKSFYRNIASFAEVDQAGDQLIPVVGCIQGGFVPRFLKNEEVFLRQESHGQI